LQDQQRENSYFVLLRVKLPKYQTSIDPNKSRVIVLAPKFRRSEVDGGLADEFKDQMIELLNGSNKLTVLDRDSLREQVKELKLIMAGNSPIKELARVGQTAGADIMVISEFSSLSSKRSDKKLGARTISRIVYNGKFTIKFIDVATMNIILTKNVSIKKRRFKSNSASAKLSRYVIGKVRPTLSKKFGLATSSMTAGKKKGTKKLKSTLFEETEKRVKQDW
jgi:curli biogenesis system outer membrane secretion channel CsgG